LSLEVEFGTVFSAWPAIEEKIQNAHHVLLLSDFDGALTPILEKPEAVMLPEPTRDLFQSLSSNNHFTGGIISGSALPDLKEKVNIEGIIYAGKYPSG
jgi:trehalose-phosphatase